MRYLVFLRRGKPADAASLGRALGVSRADADRLAKARVPQPLSVCASAEECRAQIERLRTEGFDALAITTDALARFAPVPLWRAQRRSEGILWSGTQGDFLLRPEDVRMIVLTRLRWEGRFEGKLGDDYVQASGAQETGACLLFHGTEEAYVVAQAQGSFTNLLDHPPSPTSDRMYAEVVRAIRKSYPKAVYDETLFKAPASMRSLGTSSQMWSDGADLGTSSFAQSDNLATALRLAYVVALQTL